LQGVNANFIQLSKNLLPRSRRGADSLA
jgi:hypothetical protein